MNTQVGFPIGAMVLGITAVILLTLLTFRVVASLLNGLIGRSSDLTGTPRRNSGGPLLGVFSVLVMAAVLVAGGMFRLRAARSAPASPVVGVQTGNTEELVVTSLSEARQEMQNAVHEPTIEIPLDPLALASESVASESVAVDAVAEVEQAVSDPPQAELVTETTPAAVEDTPAAASSESVEERQKRLSELAAHLGPMIRSLLQDGDGPAVPVDENAPAAAESADRKIVVFQLPGPLRKTYAWIQLTPAVEAAVSPVKPLIDNGGLEAMANALAMLLNKSSAAPTATSGTALKAPLLPSVADLSQQPLPLSQVQPEWVTKPDGGRRVAKTAAIFTGEDDAAPRLDAINQSLNEHVLDVAETFGPAFRNQALRLQLKLDQQSAQQFAVTSYERHELMETEAEGPKPLKFVYTLVEFPEAVDKVAVQEIRQALQNERALGLGLAVVFGWLAVCCIGCGVRMWSRGSFFRRTLALPVFGVMAFPLLLLAAGILIGLSEGKAINLPWFETPQSILLHIDRDI